MSRATAVLACVILAVFVAAAVRVPGAITDSHQRHRDRAAFKAWAAEHGGIKEFGAGVIETHKYADIVCTPHYPGGQRHLGADYRLYLLVDSHKDTRPAKVIRAARGPLKVKPTKGGSECGAYPKHGPPP